MFFLSGIFKHRRVTCCRMSLADPDKSKTPFKIWFYFYLAAFFTVNIYFGILPFFLMAEIRNAPLVLRF